MRRSVLLGGTTAVLLVVGVGPVAATTGDHDGATGTGAGSAVPEGHENQGDHEAEHGEDAVRAPGTDARTHGGDAGHGGSGHGETGQGDAGGHGGDDHAGQDDHADEEGDAGHDGGHGGEADDVSPRTRASVLGGFGAVNAAAVATAFVLRRRGGSLSRRRRAPDRRSIPRTGGGSLR